MGWAFFLPGGEVVDEDLCQRRRYVFASLHDHANGSDEVTRVAILAEITTGAGTQ